MMLGEPDDVSARVLALVDARGRVYSVEVAEALWDLGGHRVESRHKYVARAKQLLFNLEQDGVLTSAVERPTPRISARRYYRRPV